MKQSTILISSILAISSEAFAPSNTRPQQLTPSSNLHSTPQDEEPSGLIIGEDMSSALQGIGSEAGYLDYAKKRNEEAKAKLQEQIRLEEEETERKRREKEEKGGEGNYGPGDLSEFKGFADDGFEASVGNDETGGWGEVDEPKEEEAEEDEPKLFLFGDDDAGGDNGGLIL
jgi:hypothetical protein